MVTVFEKDEKGYLKWLRDNPAGMVINTRSKIDPGYMVLHKSSCASIQKYPGMESDPGGFTEKAYIKICSNDVNSLSEWSKRNGRPQGGFSKKCGICKP